MCFKYMSRIKAHANDFCVENLDDVLEQKGAAVEEDGEMETERSEGENSEPKKDSVGEERELMELRGKLTFLCDVLAARIVLNSDTHVGAYETMLLHKEAARIEGIPDVIVKFGTILICAQLVLEYTQVQ